jgi:type VI protein secretion system component VasK
VVFREAGLVQTGRAAREKQRKQLIGSLVAIGVATVVVLGLIVSNYLAERRDPAAGAQVSWQAAEHAPPGGVERSG